MYEFIFSEVLQDFREGGGERETGTGRQTDRARACENEVLMRDRQTEKMAEKKKKKHLPKKLY